MTNDDAPFLSLTEAQIDALASGGGDAESIHILRLGQYTRLLQSLASILDLAPAGEVNDAIRLLESAQAKDESMYVEALSYPHILVWSWATLESLLGGGSQVERERHVGHLRCVAASVAYRCGLDFTIHVPVVDGDVLLPGIGRARFPIGDPKRHAIIAYQRGALSVATDDVRVVVPRGARDNVFEGSDWQSIRVVEAESLGHTLRVAVDDIDPYRHYYALSRRFPPCSRLDNNDFKTFQKVITDGWAYLTEKHQPYAEAIATGLQVVVPAQGNDAPMSDSSPDAFGALVVTNVSSTWTAYSMLEEFQRMKLSALNYLFPLHHSTHERGDYLVTWKLQPASFRQYFETIYALPAVAEYWWGLAAGTSDSDERVNALMLHVLWRSRLDVGRRKLVESGELTDLGRRVMRTIASPPAAAVSGDIQSLCRMTETDVRISTRLQNLVPSGASIAQLADAWLAFEDVPLKAVLHCRSEAQEPLRGWQSRRRLGVRKVATGELFEDLLVNQQLLSVLEPDADVLDALIVDDQRDRVVASCCGAISEQAADPETWARLSLAHRNEQSFAAFSLVRFPEFVMSLYGEIADRSAQPPDPMEIAAWLAPRLLSHDEQDFVPAPLDNSDATPSSFGFL